jgi:hypothetical protein
MKSDDLKNVYNYLFENFETLIDYFKDGIFFIKSKWVLKVILRIILDGSQKKKPPNISVGVGSLWPCTHGIYNLM